MAAARFQIFCLRGAVTWRFMSANNRSLGRAVRGFADVEACLAAVRELRAQLACATCVTMRDGPRHWVWRVRLADVDKAVSSRRYERRVQAANSCSSFVELVHDAGEIDVAQLVRFP
ncbi:MAG TPA: hypothetical protein VH352_27800 [Pseudonocardiaceae bacterium]|nr:hypothetical protein [Pseudonocardiaceae bacterium]